MPNNIDKIRKALLDATKRRADFNPQDAEMMNTVGRDLVNALAPVLAKIMEDSRVSKESLVSDLKQALSELKIEVPPAQITATIPDVYIPEIKSPDVKIPEIKIPPISIPNIVMPDEMNVRGWVQLQGVDLNNPLPVQLRDADGNPVKLFENLTTLVSQGGGGGAAKIVKISDIAASAFATILTPDGRLKVDLASGSTGLTDAELRASSVPVAQASDAVWSVYATNPYGQGEEATALRITQAGDCIASVAVKEIFSTTAADMVNADNRLRVSVETGSSGLTDAELRASSVPVEQVSGSNWSVYATNPFGPGEEATALRVTIAGDAGASVYVKDVIPGTGHTNLGKEEDSGHNTGDVGVMALGVRNEGNDDFSGTDKDYIPISLNAKGNVYVKNAPDGFTVTGITNTVAASVVDSSGVGYSGSNPLPTTIISGALTSAVAVGDIPSDTADTGSAPLKIGGIARQTNPTAVGAGDRVSATFDDVGRQLIRPVQIRDLLATAYAALVSGSGYGTETSLLAGVSGEYHDLVYIMGSNTSSVAVKADIRASTGGTVIMSLEIPANGTAGVSLQVPLPAPFADQTWTVDLPDETGGNVYISALFSKEV